MRSERETREPASEIRRRAAGLLLLPFLLAPGSPLDAGLLDLLLRNGAERRGDYDQLAAEWLEALPRWRDDFRVELLVRRLGTIERRMREPGALIAPLEKMLAEDVLEGTARQVAIDLLRIEYLRAGRRDDRDRLQSGRGILQSFMLVGPFGKGKSGVLRRSFPPEKELEFSRAYRDGWQELRWRPLLRKRPETLIDPSRHVFPPAGVVYLLSQVRAAEASPAQLHVGGLGKIKVWVNGRTVFDDGESSEFRPLRRVRGIRLRSGWNRILVKTGDRFWARLADPRGNPFPPQAVREESEPALRAAAPEPPGEPPPEPVETAISLWEARLNDPAATGGESPEVRQGLALEHLGLGILYRLYGRHELSVERVERALELAPEDPFVLHHAARTFRDARYLPSNLSKNRAKGAWDKVLKLDPGFLPARVHVARYLLADEQAGKAAGELEKALEQEPRFLYGLLELHRVFHDRDWEADARRVLERIREIAPGSAFAPLREADRYRSRDNLGKAVELYREAYRLDGTNVALLETISLLEARRGRLDEAEELLRQRLALEPDNPEALSDLAEFLSHRGDHDAALELRRRRLADAPWDPSAHVGVAAALEHAGSDGEAREHYRKALGLAPGDLRLRRYLARAGRGGEFWEPYDEDVENWLHRIPADGPFVDRAEAVIVIDVTVVRVEEDGSSSEYIHQAIKLLSEEGKDSLAEVSTPGEIITLRTLRPDGAVLEPVPALGREKFVMPGLEPEVITEFAYLNRYPDARGAPFRNGPFFFQDFLYKRSFLLSRYVLILPPAHDTEIVERNLRSSNPEAQLVQVEKTVKDLADGSRVVTYEARNAARIEREPQMPTREEYVPNILAVPRQSWEDVAESLRERTASSTLRTPELERVAAEVADGVEDPLEKARALYARVVELVTDESGSSDAVGTLLEKSGDRTILFKALLDLAGVPSRWAYLRQPEVVLPRTEWSYPSTAMFPSRFVLVELPERDPLWVTLRFRRSPFGRLPEQFGGGTALVLTPRGHAFVKLPEVPPDDHATVTEARYRLADGLEADVALAIATRSTGGYAQKERFRTLPAFQTNLALRSYANQMFPGARVRKAEFQGLQDAATPLGLLFELEAPNLLRQAGDDFALRAVQQPSSMVRRFGGAIPRRHPYHLRSGRAARDTLRIDPGSRLRLHRLPDDVGLASRLGLYSLRFKAEGEEVLVERRLTLNPGRLDPDEFPAFLEFCERIDAAERESIVFRGRR